MLDSASSKTTINKPFFIFISKSPPTFFSAIRRFWNYFKYRSIGIGYPHSVVGYLDIVCLLIVIYFLTTQSTIRYLDGVLSYQLILL